MEPEVKRMRQADSARRSESTGFVHPVARGLQSISVSGGGAQPSQTTGSRRRGRPGGGDSRSFQHAPGPSMSAPEHVGAAPDYRAEQGQQAVFRPIRPRVVAPPFVAGSAEKSSPMSGITSSGSVCEGTSRLRPVSAAEQAEEGPVRLDRTQSGFTVESRLLQEAVNTDLALGPGVRPSRDRPESASEQAMPSLARVGCMIKQLPALPGLLDSPSISLSPQVWFPASSSSSGQPRWGSEMCPPHGMLSVLGRRRDLEDMMSVVPAFGLVPRQCLGLAELATAAEEPGQPAVGSSDSAALHFFGVFDGHGGVQAAKFSSDRMHQAVAEELREAGCGAKAGLSLEAMLRECLPLAFRRVDNELAGICPHLGRCGREPTQCHQEPVAPEAVGTTAVVTVISPSQIIVANCGDSRAVLSRGGAAIPLSVDHKPEREDEMQRVEAAGGRVIYYNGYRVLGVLAMSRALGDRCLKPFVIAEPEVTCTTRSAEDECLIMASDGLWDVMSNEEVCDIARRCVLSKQGTRVIVSDPSSPLAGQDPQSAVAAALLTKMALARGSGDNITVVVIKLLGGARP